MTDWKASLRADPIPWLLENACAPIRYRVLTELLDRRRDDPQVVELRKDVVNDAAARKLERTQRKDGSWAGTVHAGDPRRFQASIENGLCRLFELGWDRDAKAVRTAAKTLRTYLTAKRDVPFFEFTKAIKADERREQYFRWYLRILALGLLVPAGYVDDRSRLAVLELLDLTAGFVDSPVSRNPVEEIGASLPLIRSAAFRQNYVFLPDLYILRVFAHSPWLLDGEMAKMRLKKVFDYVLSPTYQALAPGLGLVRTAKGSFPKGSGIRIHASRALPEARARGRAADRARVVCAPRSDQPLSAVDGAPGVDPVPAGEGRALEPPDQADQRIQPLDERSCASSTTGAARSARRPTSRSVCC